MRIYIEYNESLLYKNFRITQKKDGRRFCNVPVYYDIDESGNKTWHYHSIYGCDDNEIKIKRAKFISEQIEETQNRKLTSELFITKMNEWLYNHKYRKIKATSFDRLEETFIYQILPALKDCNFDAIKLTDVTKKHIESIMDYNLNKGYSFSTLKKIQQFLSAFFKYSEDEIIKNPMTKYEFYKKEAVLQTQEQLRESQNEIKEKIKNGRAISESEFELLNRRLKSQIDQSDIHCFTDEEIARMKDIIENGYYLDYIHPKNGQQMHNGPFFLKQGEYLLFILNTGLRCGEAAALKYSDFDFQNLTVSIRNNVISSKERDENGKVTGRRPSAISTVKTQESKKVLTISAYAAEIIQKLKSQEVEGYDGYILHNGDKPIGVRALAKRFYNLLHQAGVAKCGMHSLRHTYASKLYEETDGDSKFVSEQLRHSDVSFTQKTYIHQAEKRKEKLLKEFKI